MNKTILLLALPLALSFPSFASVYGVDFTSVGTQVSVSDWSLGYKFIANNPISVVGLGTFDYGQNGFASPQQVGLWNSSGTLLASTFVDNSDPLTGFWRFASITPVALTPGSTYYVASEGGEGYTFFTGGFTVNPNITYIQDAWHYNASTTNSPLAFPDTSDFVSSGSGGAFFGGNVELADTPEPAFFIPVFGGLAVLASVRRRRKT
jgi:hypothetical protein